MEKIKEAFENFTDRIRSPFWGSFILIWCYVNWRILYALVYDGSLSLSDRLIAVEDEIRFRSYWQNYWLLLFKPLIFTVVSLIVYYVLAAWGLMIKESYIIWGKPSVLDFVKKKAKTVPMDDYRKLERILEREREKSDDYKTKHLNSDKTNKELRKKLKATTLLNSSFESEIKQLKQDVQSAQEIAVRLDEELQEARRKIQEINPSYPRLSAVFILGTWKMSYINNHKPSRLFHIENNYFIEKAKESEITDLITYNGGQFVKFKKTELEGHLGQGIQPVLGVRNNELIKVKDNVFIGMDGDERVEYKFITHDITVLIPESKILPDQPPA